MDQNVIFTETCSHKRRNNFECDSCIGHCRCSAINFPFLREPHFFSRYIHCSHIQSICIRGSSPYLDIHRKPDESKSNLTPFVRHWHTRGDPGFKLGKQDNLHLSKRIWVGFSIIWGQKHSNWYAHWAWISSVYEWCRFFDLFVPLTSCAQHWVANGCQVELAWRYHEIEWLKPNTYPQARPAALYLYF